MKKEIKISIVVPVYNVEKYLDKCLNSIINQSLKEIEIIVVNDCSPDDSLEIIKKYMQLDERIVLINKVKNEGVSEARNSAIEIARGEYILNIDSDDWIEQDYFLDMYEKAKKQDLDMLISDIKFVYEKKIEILKDLKIKDDEVINGEEYLEIFFLNNTYGYTWNKLIKANLYKENNLKYNKNRKLIEDLELLGQLSLYCKRIGKLNKAYYNYRQGDNNSSRKKNIKSLNDWYDGFAYLVEFYKNKKMINIEKMVNLLKNVNIFIGLFHDKEYKKIDGYDEFLKKIICDLKKEKYIMYISKKGKKSTFKRSLFHNFLKIVALINERFLIKLLK